MREEKTRIPFAWEPLTPPGIAAFARAPVQRLWLVQVLCALVAAATVVWFLERAWFPTVSAAIRALPPTGQLRAGRLEWPAASPQLLAEGDFLAFGVDLGHEGQVRSAAHVQVEFGREDFYVFSLLGYQRFAYPTQWQLAFNRSELEPKWGAWRPALLGLCFGAVVLGLMIVWTLLATLYFPLAWFVGYRAGRSLNCRGSWKLAGAALMPGALLWTAALACYGLGALDLVQLSAAFLAHLVISWIYLLAAPLLFTRRQSVVAKPQNPFASPPSPAALESQPKSQAPPPSSNNL
jgi:hypothetical protein